MNLSELIETHKGRRSYPELERDCGGKPSSKRLQQLARDPIKNFPDPPTVEALARGLKVPQRVVILAAAESLGLDVHDVAPRVLQLMPAAAAELSEAQAAAIAHLVDVIVSDPLRQADPRLEVVADKTMRRLRTEPSVESVRQSQERARAGLSAVAPNVDDAVAADQDEDPDLAAGEAEEPEHP